MSSLYSIKHFLDTVTHFYTITDLFVMNDKTGKKSKIYKILKIYIYVIVINNDTYNIFCCHCKKLNKTTCTEWGAGYYIIQIIRKETEGSGN